MKPKAYLGHPQFLGWSSLKYQLMVFPSPTDVARSFTQGVARVLDPTLKIDVETIYFLFYLIFKSCVRILSTFKSKLNIYRFSLKSSFVIIFIESKCKKWNLSANFNYCKLNLNHLLIESQILQELFHNNNYRIKM